MKAQTRRRHVKTRAGEAEMLESIQPKVYGKRDTEVSQHSAANRRRMRLAKKPRTIQQKSMHHKRDKQISLKVGPASEVPSDEGQHWQNSDACVDGHCRL